MRACSTCLRNCWLAISTCVHSICRDMAGAAVSRTTRCRTGQTIWRSRFRKAAPCWAGHWVGKWFCAPLLADPQATLLRFLSLQTRGVSDQKSLLQQLRQHFLALPQARAEALSGGLTILRETDLRQQLPRLAQPTLVLHGALDALTPAAAGRWLAETLPDARYVELARAAHAPQLSHSADVAAAFGRFAHD